ncbi:MAG: hypothetical protein MUF48_11160 [Pirellulaceae bacterium]|jgi:hypothetical protein|nr:hypothetical protein [Pirellulaceae bacterium]
MMLVPHYDLISMRRVAHDRVRVVYRPTLHTALLRLRISLVCLLVLVIVQLSTRGLHRSGSAATPDPSALGAVAAESLAPVDVLGRSIAWTAHTISIALFGLALFAPLSCLWGRTVVENNAAGQLAVFSLVYWPRRRTWPPDHLGSLRVWAMERYWFYRRRMTGHAWEWYVQLTPRGGVSMPFGPGIAAQGITESPEFLICRQASAPHQDDPLPEPVREFASAVAHLTGLTVEPFRLVAAEVHRRRWGYPRVVSKTTHQVTFSGPGARTSSTQTYASLQDMPPELRQRVAEMLQSGQVTRKPDGTLEIVSEQVTRSETLEGADLDAHLDALPPEVRDMLRRGRRRRRS